MAALAVLCSLTGCSDSRPWFVQIEAEEARTLYAAGEIGLVHAVAAVAPESRGFAGGSVWRVPSDDPVRLDAAPQDLPTGDLMIVALRAEVGLRLAAALARPRNRQVYLFIPQSAEEQRSLYAVRSPQREEIPRGQDS